MEESEETSDIKVTIQITNKEELTREITVRPADILVQWRLKSRRFADNDY